MQDHQSKKIVVAVIFHVSPEHLADFYLYLNNYKNARIVFTQESNEKLWITKGGDR